MDLDTDALLKLVLVLVVVWLALEVVGEFFEALSFILAPSKLLGLVIIGLIALYLLDRL